MAFNSDSFSAGLNTFLDTAAAFRDSFRDHREMHAVAVAITVALLDGLGKSVDDPAHPFNRYVSYDKTYRANLRQLRDDVRNVLQNSRTRGYATSFFHDGGVNYEDMAELFDDFWDFAADSFDDDEDDEDDEDDVNGV
jgi:hypothetical protein